ncbi:hypothetical protein GCM10018965_045660 [Nonomuraea roseola]
MAGRRLQQIVDRDPALRVQRDPDRARIVAQVPGEVLRDPHGPVLHAGIVPQGGRNLLRIHIREPTALLPSGDGGRPAAPHLQRAAGRGTAQPPQAAKTNVSFSIE